MKSFQVYACPYCGGGLLDLIGVAEAVEHGKRGHCVKCQACRMSGPIMPTSEEAVQAWNDIAGIATADAIVPEE